MLDLVVVLIMLVVSIVTVTFILAQQSVFLHIAKKVESYSFCDLQLVSNLQVVELL